VKFVRLLSDTEVAGLERIHRESPHHRERQRAHAILLSSRGYCREVIADICGASRDTVSLWLERFEHQGMEGLRDVPKPGRPPKLTRQAQEMIAQTLHHPTPRLKPLLLERLKKGA
jgi:transposase